MKPLFAVIYRGFLLPGKEEDYLKNWKLIATFFVEERGSLGSALHKTEDGMWVAYSKWPDRATRDASWPTDEAKINQEIPKNIQEAIVALKSCLDPEREEPEIRMELLEEVTT